MKKTKIVSISLAMILCMGLFTGCGKSAKGTFKRYAKCADVKNYTGVEYVPESREVTQDDIDKAIDSFCDDNSETVEDKTSNIADGDKLNIDYVEKISGAEHDSQTGYTLTVGEDKLGDGFDAQLIGVKPGTTKTVKISYPDDYSDTEVAGLDAEFEVTINYISVTKVPEYTDELVNKATEGEFTTTDAYTEHLTEELQNQKNESADETDRANVLKSIRDNTTFEKYPENEVQDYVKSIIENMESSAGNYGIDFQTYLMYFYGYTNEADFIDFLTEAVESVMKEKIVVCSIALKEDLMATDEEIQSYKQEVMEENGMEDEADLDEYYSEEDLLFYATEEKVLDFLMESAVQVDETDTTEDAVTTEETSEE